MTVQQDPAEGRTFRVAHSSMDDGIVTTVKFEVIGGVRGREHVYRRRTHVRAADPLPVGRVAHRSTSATSRRAEPRQRSKRSAVRGAAKRASARSGNGPDDPGEPEPPGGERSERLCLCGCGRDISHKRPDALTFNGACRTRMMRERSRAGGELLRPIAATLCDCGTLAISLEDGDGDPSCLRCGHLIGPTSHVNGYDAAAWLMATNGTGSGARAVA